MKQAQVFVDVEEITQLILDLTPKEAKCYGIKHRSDLIRLKNNVKGGKLNFRSKLMKKFIVNFGKKINYKIIN